MNYDDKKQLLENAKELARQLEEVTDEFIEVQIGWISGVHVHDIPLTIMVNHNESWFGDFEPMGWNEQVVFNNIGGFTPVKNPYLALNKLIDKAYH